MQILQIINTPEQDHNLNWQVYWTTEQDNKVSVHSASYRSLDDAILKITTLNQQYNEQTKNLAKYKRK